MNSRKEQATVRYRQKLNDLGLDDLFEYVEFIKKGSHRLRCRQCGEMLTRSDDIFKGKTQRIKCRNCGNGSVLYSKEVDEVLAFYAEGHSLNETAEKFGIKKTQVMNWAKYRRVSNGRDALEILRECNRKRSTGELPMPDASYEAVRRKAKDHQTARLKEQGFEYIEGSKTSKKFTIRCMACDCVFTRNYSSIYKPINCPECSKQKRQELRQKKTAEHQAELQLKRDKRRARQEKKEQDELDRLNAPHICEVCGQTYTINDYMKSTCYKYRRNSGVCSAKCRDERGRQKYNAAKAKRGSHSCNHYSRARKLGLPKERGITLKNLVKRDGLTCAICGFPCYYYGTGKEDLYPSIDHIVPMHKGGGHTWDNVQIAHRICNSNKRDYVGEEWNNTEGGEQA